MAAVRQKGAEKWLPASQVKGRTEILERREPGELYLATDKGERKATGSYYTPDYIVKYIVEQTLGPLVERVRQEAAGDTARFVAGILQLNVLDPAMGSGHFLVEATDFLARALATGADVPGADNLPKVLNLRKVNEEADDLVYWRRQVVERCIYGVDINPMAVELCQVALWMEALEPGKPLSFLDHHVQCGNSLLGTTPALLAKGIPDEAFEPIEGDDKKWCSALKRQNKEDRNNQPRMFEDDLKPWEQLGNLPAATSRSRSSSLGASR